LVEVPSFEQIFDRDEPLHLFIIARHPRVCTRALFDTHELEPDNLTYDVRPDGQQFLVSRKFEGGAVRPMNVCLNCLADTKR
jgi:hypothetical protein